MEYTLPNELEIAYEGLKDWKPCLYDSPKDFIIQTTIAYQPNMIRQYISLYLFEEACNPIVSDFLYTLLKKSDEELSFYRIVNDGSHRLNYTLIRPSLEKVRMYFKKEESPYIFINFGKDEKKEMPNTPEEGIQRAMMSISQAKTDKETWEGRFKERILNPLLDDLLLAIEKKDEEEKEKIKKHLSMYY